MNKELIILPPNEYYEVYDGPIGKYREFHDEEIIYYADNNGIDGVSNSFDLAKNSFIVSTIIDDRFVFYIPSKLTKYQYNLFMNRLNRIYDKYSYPSIEIGIISNDLGLVNALKEIKTIADIKKFIDINTYVETNKHNKIIDSSLEKNNYVK